MGNAPSAPNSPKSRPAEVVRSDTLSSLYIPEPEGPLTTLLAGFDQTRPKRDASSDHDSQASSSKDAAPSDPPSQDSISIAQDGKSDVEAAVENRETQDVLALQAVQTSPEVLAVHGELPMGPTTAASEVRHFFSESPAAVPATLPEVAEIPSPSSDGVMVEDVTGQQAVQLEAIQEEPVTPPISAGPMLPGGLEESAPQTPVHNNLEALDVQPPAAPCHITDDQPPDYAQHATQSPAIERTVSAMHEQTHEHLSVMPLSSLPVSQPCTPVAGPATRSPLSPMKEGWGTGTYVLTNARSGTALDLSAGDMKTLTGWPTNGGANQQWEFIPCGPGYMIRTACNWPSGLYLAVADSIVDGAVVIASPFPVAWNVEVLEQERAVRI